MSDIALRFIVANLAASVAILIVLVLRKPIRAAFGARIAYALWLLVPLAALGSLVPPRVIEIARPAITFYTAAAPAPELVAAEPALQTAVPETPPQSAPVFTIAPELSPVSSHDLFSSLDPWAIGALVWFIGMLATIAWLARNQSRFMADVRVGLAGPAVAGFLKPRIITPADFEDRFDRSEREVILAHEGIHLSRNDARINAAVALARCLAWFNPLVHIAAHVMRIDQELACDAAVVARHPRAKAVYASALLKAQLAARPLPLGCYWPAGDDHPLTERIEMLKRTAPGRFRRLAGAGAIIILAVAAGAAAWAAKPPEERFVDARGSQDGPVRAQPEQIEAATSRGDAPFDAAAALPALDTPTPAPQQTPAPVAGPDFDPKDPVHLFGKVERIDFSDRTYVALVRAISTAACPTGPSQTNTQLWALAPMPHWGDRDAVERDLLNQNVYVRGFNAKDKSCTPNCRMEARAVFKANGATSLSQASMVGFSDPALACGPPAQAGAQQTYRLPINPTNSAMFLPFPAASAAGSEMPGSITLDANKPIYLRGRVEQIDFGKTSYVLHVRATSISPDFGNDRPSPFYATPAALAWELSPTNYFGDADAIRTDLMGKDIEVSGINLNQDCKPGCKLKMKQLYTPFSGEVPLYGVGESTIAFFNLWYDGSTPLSADGKVERIEFSDRTFDAYVRTAAQGMVPSRLLQVRSAYHYPRADIERELTGKSVSVSGWAARERAGAYCSPVCGMYADRFVVGVPSENRVRVTPDGSALTAYVPPPTAMAGRSLAPIPPLRIVVLKHERLKVVTGAGETLVDRDFPPGTTYYLSVGRGWTISTPDGSAFRWQVNDKPAGPVADGPVDSLKVDDVAQRLNVPVTQSAPAAAQQPPNTLRIVALKRERLEISSRDATKFVDRYFEPGEQYLLGGAYAGGWTISTPDGSAFEWRSGDASFGPVGAGPLDAQSITALSQRAAQAAAQRAAPQLPPPPPQVVPAKPQPTRYEPQQIPGVPRDYVAFASLFDADDPIMVKGKVMQVDLTQPYVYLWVRASEATETGKPGMQPNTAVFRAMLGRAATSPDWVNPSLVGKEVTVRGYRAKDKTCTDSCLINGRDVTVDGIRNVWPTASVATATPQPIQYQPQQQATQAPIQIKSATSKYLQAEGRMTYTGNVQLSQGDYQLASDNLSVSCRRTASEQCQEVQAITADGNVVFTDADLSIRSNRAEQDPRSGVITFTGNVTSQRDGQIVRGEKAIYNTADRRIRVGGDRVTSSPAAAAPASTSEVRSQPQL